MAKDTITKTEEKSYKTQESYNESEYFTEIPEGQSKTNTIPKTSSSSNFVDFIIAFLKFILEAIATAFEVVIRKNFGERYFTPLKFLIGLFLIIILMFGSFTPPIEKQLQPTKINEEGRYTDPPNLFQRPFNKKQQEERTEVIEVTSRFNRIIYDIPSNSDFSFAFFLVYLILYLSFGFSEFGKQAQRTREGTAWHSYHVGESRFNVIPTIAEDLQLKTLVNSPLTANYISHLYIEPLFFLSLGLVLLFFAPVFSGFLIIGTVFIFIKGQLIYNKVKHQILDIKDNKIESKFMAEAIKGVDPKQTAGLSVLSIKPAKTNNAVSTYEALENVFNNNPALEKLAGIKFEKPE